ncbi:twin-arginine translocation pathway signal protein [Ramlibacter sp. WS9]|nr:twin-arginine translocation pathway signal protein [Ramlibacter sp. WS9]
MLKKMKQQPSVLDAHRRTLIRGAGGVALLSAVGHPVAQTKLSPLKIVCGYAAGGTVDQLSRQVASKMQLEYTHSVIVDNKPGALGQLAISQVKMQPTDGNTILASPMPLLSLFPHVYKSLPYDPVADFVILTAATRAPYAYAVGRMVPVSVRSVKDYWAWVKTDSKHATVAVAGVLPQLICLMMSKISGVEMVPAMYRGGQLAALDALAGNVPAMVASLGDIKPHLGEGKLRLLALASDNRNPSVPEVPTFAEQGISDMDVSAYTSFFVRAGTSSEIVERHSTALRAALAQKDVIDALGRLAMEVVPADPKESTEILKKDSEKWAAFVKRIGYAPT